MFHIALLTPEKPLEFLELENKLFPSGLIEGVPRVNSRKIVSIKLENKVLYILYCIIIRVKNALACLELKNKLFPWCLIEGPATRLHKTFLQDIGQWWGSLRARQILKLKNAFMTNKNLYKTFLQHVGQRWGSFRAWQILKLKSNFMTNKNSSSGTNSQTEK